jgi:hypothetical protein
VYPTPSAAPTHALRVAASRSRAGPVRLRGAPGVVRRKRKSAQGLEQASQNGAHVLVPHTPTCPCAACEEARKKILQAGIETVRKRRRHYAPGHEHPEHREGWRISPEQLADFMATHESIRDRKGKTTRVEMRPAWLDHLDGLVIQYPGLSVSRLRALARQGKVGERVYQQTRFGSMPLSRPHCGVLMAGPLGRART